LDPSLRVKQLDLQKPVSYCNFDPTLQTAHFFGSSLFGYKQRSLLISSSVKCLFVLIPSFTSFGFDGYDLVLSEFSLAFLFFNAIVSN